MPWMPVINDNDKAASLTIGVVAAGGMATMFVVGVPWIRAFLYSVPVAFLVALGIRYWHNRHKVDIITLRSAAESTDKTISTRSR